MESLELQSERVIIAAPFSFTGSAQRIWPLAQRGSEPWGRILYAALAVTLISLAWTGVLAWYLMWGLLLVPYRLIRRGARKRERDALQHREILAAVERGSDHPPAVAAGDELLKAPVAVVDQPRRRL